MLVFKRTKLKTTLSFLSSHMQVPWKDTVACVYLYVCLCLCQCNTWN